MITLTTDFGRDSPYVAQMRGAILQVDRRSTIIDITHSIPRHDISQASHVLADTTPCFPAKTVHIAVVDPGVGTERAILAARMNAQYFIAPDNGLLSALVRRAEQSEIVELDKPAWWRSPVSPTFHGRDIMAPVAAHLARGTDLLELGTPVAEIVEGPSENLVVREQGIEGEVILVDSFGNVITNVRRDLVDAQIAASSLQISAGNQVWHRFNATYDDVSIGESCCLFDSQGRLEIAINQGHAANRLALAVGTPVRIRW